MAFKSHFSNTLRCFAAIKIKDSNPTTSQKATKANCISPHRTPVISQQKRWWWCFVKWPLKAPLQMLYVIWKMCLSTALFHKKLHNLGFPPLFCLQTDINKQTKKPDVLAPQWAYRPLRSHGLLRPDHCSKSLHPNVRLGAWAGRGWIGGLSGVATGGHGTRASHARVPHTTPTSKRSPRLFQIKNRSAKYGLPPFSPPPAGLSLGPMEIQSQGVQYGLVGLVWTLLGLVTHRNLLHTVASSW